MTPNMLTGAPAQSQQQTPAQAQIAAAAYAHQQFGNLAAKPNLSFDDVANVAANFVRNGMPADHVASQLTTVPRDRGKMRAWALLRQAEASGHIDRLKQSYGGG